MTSTSSEFGLRYCSLCDEYFFTKETLQQHMQASPRHPHCTTCKRSYLNMNSLRNHFVYSSRHHYCRPCDKSFQSASGLRVHLAQSPLHSEDSDDEEAEDDREPGWEDEVARQEDEAERRRQSEDEFSIEDDKESSITPITRRMGLLNLNKRKISTPPSVSRHICPICLAGTSSVSATRCGHIFCTSCIEHVIENTGMCPTCRKPGVLSHLRKIDICVY